MDRNTKADQKKDEAPTLQSPCGGTNMLGGGCISGLMMERYSEQEEKMLIRKEKADEQPAKPNNTYILPADDKGHGGVHHQTAFSSRSGCFTQEDFM